MNEQDTEQQPTWSYTVEATILGAMILEPTAISDAIEVLVAADFYNTSHQKIYGVLVEMTEAGEAVDLVTLWQSLERRKLAEEVGGPAYLAELTTGIPRNPSIASYLRILRDKALLRSLQVLAQEVANRATDNAELPSKLISDIEERIMELSGRSSGSGFKSMLESMQDAGGLDAYVDQKCDAEVVQGVPTGFVEFDKLTGGLHNKELVIVAARPGQGKTALAICIAVNVAHITPQHVVAVFSLEMSREALEDRMIAAYGMVDWKQVQRGFITREIRSRIAGASRWLAEKTIVVDDTATITITQLRAKARKLKQKYGRLDLTVVDYLQLVAPGHKYGNREQEVAAVSRGLKAMAKELDVPVLALAQLSRSNEQRKDKRPMLSELRECVKGDTRVVEANTGRMVAIQDLKSGSVVLAMNKIKKVGGYRVADVWSTGCKQTFKVTTASGRSITCTNNHPFFSEFGWKPLADLSAGSFVASAWRAPVDVLGKNFDLCRLMGYLAGDGTMQKSREVGFISNDPETFADVRAIVAEAWPEVTITVKPDDRGYLNGSFVRIYKNGCGKPYGNPMREWLRSSGCVGQRDCTKRVPQFVFEAGESGAAEFLAGYLATDGCVKKENYRKAHGWRVHFDTTSRLLADDVQGLLQRLGIASNIGNGRWSKKSSRPIYRITVSQHKPNLARFCTLVPVRGKKKALLAEAKAWATDGGISATNQGPFGLPPQVSRHLAIIDSDLKWRDQGKCMSRAIAATAAERLGDEALRVFASSDLLWERIVSIKDAGEAEVYDLSVPEANCFVANGLIVHNSGQLEQDADVVTFIHREEMYAAAGDPDTEWGVAELITAKQRQGPTGVVKLAYMAEYTRFENLAYERATT